MCLMLGSLHNVRGRVERYWENDNVHPQNTHTGDKRRALRLASGAGDALDVDEARLYASVEW